MRKVVSMVLLVLLCSSMLMAGSHKEKDFPLYFTTLTSSSGPDPIEGHVCYAYIEYGSRLYWTKTVNAWGGCTPLPPNSTFRGRFRSSEVIELFWYLNGKDGKAGTQKYRILNIDYR